MVYHCNETMSRAGHRSTHLLFPKLPTGGNVPCRKVCLHVSSELLLFTPQWMCTVVYVRDLVTPDTVVTKLCLWNYGSIEYNLITISVSTLGLHSPTLCHCLHYSTVLTGQGSYYNGPALSAVLSYIMGCGASSVPTGSSLPEGSSRGNNDPSSKYTVQVNEVWVEVKKTLEVQMGKKKPRKNLVIKRLGWKTIRVFVSSTFKDFHQEREVLVKKVNVNPYLL